MGELERFSIPLLIAFIGALARIIFDAGKLTLGSILRGLFIGVTVGGLVALAMEPTNIPPAWKGAIIGVASIISEDVLSAIIQAGGKLRENPEDFIKQLFKWRK